MRLEAAAATDIGLARKLNEDYPNTKNSERLQAATTKLSVMETANPELKAQVDRLLEIIHNVGVTPEPAKTAPSPRITSNSCDSVE